MRSRIAKFVEKIGASVDLGAVDDIVNVQGGGVRGYN